MGTQVHAELALLLVEIEGSLRGLSLWDAAPPAPERLASEVPFCHDTLEFYQWLQWIFIPRFRALLDGGLPLPAACAIAPLAEQTFAELAADTDPLVAQLRRFDEIVTGNAGAAAR